MARGWGLWKLSRMDMQWILEGLKKPGKSRSGLAKAMQRAPSMVTALLRGNRELKAREIETIAKYLEVEPPAALPIEPVDIIRTANIIGEVKGGSWSEPGVFRPIPSTVAVENRWPIDAVFLLRVVGTSINRQAKDGDLVLCLDLYAAPRDFREGDWVIAERIDADDRIDTTVKRVAKNRRGGFVLVPDSDDPLFQEPIPIGKQDGKEVRVRAFVIEFIKKATNF
jgi:transcriptional regulator with XRE-family HTH domain